MWRSPTVLEGMGSACSALTTMPLSSSAHGGQRVSPQVGIRTGAVPGTWRVLCERGVKGRTHGQRQPCQPASPQEGPAGACVCGALGPAAQRGSYLNSGHHSSGDPRLATHPGGFSCRIKGAVRYT